MARAEAAEERARQLENSSADLARKLEEAGAKERSMQQVGSGQRLGGRGLCGAWGALHAAVYRHLWQAQKCCGHVVGVVWSQILLHTAFVV